MGWDGEATREPGFRLIASRLRLCPVRNSTASALMQCNATQRNATQRNATQPSPPSAAAARGRGRRQRRTHSTAIASARRAPLLSASISALPEPDDVRGEAHDADLRRSPLLSSPLLISVLCPPGGKRWRAYRAASDTARRVANNTRLGRVIKKRREMRRAAAACADGSSAGQWRALL